MTHGLSVSGRRLRDAAVSLTSAALLLSACVAQAAPPAGKVTPSSSQRAAKGGKQKPGINTYDNAARANGNNVDMFVSNHGSYAFDISTGNAGLIYPKGTQKTAVFAAGLWVGGKVGGQTRVAIGEYSQEYAPGPMANGASQTDSPDFRNYTITRGNTSSEDYVSWASGAARSQGAPVDATGTPVLYGDQDVWSVYNDADPSVHVNRAGSTTPLGIQVEQTAFQFARQGPLGNTVFMKFKITNASTHTIDSTYVSLWSDPDLGGAGDDLVGCDTTLSLGYVYNATNNDQLYGGNPPAIGFDFLQGPKGSDGQRLGMKSFNKYINGTDPQSPAETYNYMRGLLGSGDVYNYGGSPSNYVATGDPVTNTGDLDTNPADRRMMLSTGPFTMAPGDTQVVVVAVIAAQGSDRLSSITLLKNYDDAVQKVFDQNFDIPSPPPNPTLTARPLDKSVDLIWGTEAVGNVQENAALGQKFEHEGYNVYQGASAAGPWKKIATYDVENDYAAIYSDVFDPTVGGVQRVITQNGTNTGLENHLTLDTDALRGGPLLNGTEYYYAVTAYSIDTNNAAPFEINGNAVGTIVENLESPIVAHAVTPAGSGATFTDVATHTAGVSLGTVNIDYIDQSAVKDHTYQVVFKSVEGSTVYDIVDKTAGNMVKASNQTDQSGGYTANIVDGMMVRVKGPDPAVINVAEVLSDGTLKTVEGSNNLNSTGQWYEVPRTDPAHSSPEYGRHIGSVWVGSGHYYEIRFTAAATEHAFNFDDDNPLPFTIPVQLWDLGVTPNDPSDDKRVSFLLLDNGDNVGSYGWGDGMYFWDIPYDDVDWNNLTKPADDYDPAGALFSWRRFFFWAADGSSTGYPAPGTKVRVVPRPINLPGDVFQWVGKPVGTTDGTVLGIGPAALQKIRVVPNPYLARSKYETNQFNRILKFTNIPASKNVTLTIYNLAGDLIRTLHKDASTSSGGTDVGVAGNAIMTWDLLTERSLPVASGIYIYHMNVEGVGETKGQFVIFGEKERLNTY